MTIILLGAIILTAVAYFMLANIVFAIWFPHRAKRRWVDFVNSPTIELSRPFFKWIMPVLLLTMPAWLLWQAVAVTFE